MAQGILLDKTNVLEVKVVDDCFEVIYGFHTFASFHRDDALAKRATVVQLVGMGVAKTRIADAFDVNRASIYFWEETYRSGGMRALLSLEKGPMPKLSEAMKDYIYALHKNLKGARGMREKIAQEVKKLYGVEVSRERIRRAVNERKAGEEPSAASDGERGVGAEQEGESGGKPVEVKHGGALLGLPLLEKYGVEQTIIDRIIWRRGGYGFKECVFSLLLLLGTRLLKVEENIKHYDDELMGGLIGRRRLPSLKTVRRVIGEATEQIAGQVEQMKSEYALKCLEVWGYEGAFYLDGHFMPYTGAEAILYGYNPQRRKPEKGRTAYVVTTADGRPFYEVLSDGFDDFKVNIEKIAGFLTEEAGVARPTLVFDRGGFDWEGFKRIEQRANFICWYNGNPAIPTEGVWREVQVPREGNRYGESEYVKHEWKEGVLEQGEEGGQGHRRIIFIKKGQKISPAITNLKDATGEQVALMLTGRWGAQENVFKELVIDGLDKIHSYGKDEYDQEYFEQEGIDGQRMMENPEYRKLEQEKRKLQNKRDLSFGRIAQKEKQSGKTVRPTKQQRERLAEMEQRLTEIAKRLEYLPKTIRRTDHIKGSGLVRLSNAKKKYFDLLNLVAYNVRRDMVEIVGPVYHNNRDVHQLVLKILRLTTTVECSDTHTKVVFDQPLRGKAAKALQEMCRRATLVGCETELFSGELSFSVR